MRKLLIEVPDDFYVITFTAVGSTEKEGRVNWTGVDLRSTNHIVADGDEWVESYEDDVK